ncbi:MAG: carbohydrate kinase [Anaerolineae bacterium]|nr:carbohydrate kinase [Anaerolineae bacterium]
MVAKVFTFATITARLCRRCTVLWSRRFRRAEKVDERRLQSLTSRFSDVHVLVVGDYFLDYYLDIDRTLSQVSLETGLEAYQVINVRSSPGAAGTVTSNLRALDVQVTALGVIGQDGMGYELQSGLRERGVDDTLLIQDASRFTPTYTKPMLREPAGDVHELNRLDITNRRPMPPAIQARIIASLKEQIDRVDGIIVADQVPERNCGVITDRVRDALADLALAYPDKIIAVDSRVRIGEFRNVVIKPNAREAVLAVQPGCQQIDRDVAKACAARLYEQNARPVFLTVGADGILVFDGDGLTCVPGVRVSGPIDIVGAGDSTMAGIVASLCCGARTAEAALVGNLVASITIQQIGTTGTATQEQVLERYREWRHGQN